MAENKPLAKAVTINKNYMSKKQAPKKGNLEIITPQSAAKRPMPTDGKCEECGKKDELRPYGKGGKWICFPCGMKDEETTSRNFKKVINGKGV